MNENKIILITGGCGYIGSHTALNLLHKGFQVISIDNFSRSKQFIPERIRAISGKDFLNYDIDCCDLPKLRNIVASHTGIIGIIHFAALKSVGESVQVPLMYYDNNLNSTLNLLRITEEFNIRNFVFSSSCSLYGNIDELPVTEETKINLPESPYGWTKLISEKMIESYAKQSTANYVSLRYFNPVGAHSSGSLGEIPYGAPDNIIPALTQTAMGKREKIIVYGDDYPTRDGSCIRDYIHVMDIAEAHSLALHHLIENKNDSNYEVYNLGSGEGVSVLEIIQAFEKANNLKLNFEIGKRREGDVISIFADNKKAKEKLNWICKYSLEDMMRTAWLWEQNMQKENISA